MNLLDVNGRLGQYPCSWYADSTNINLDLSSLRENLRVDICVIGAGFSGLSTALHLARSGRTVCVIDAHRIGWGASGRNGGQLGSGQRIGQLELERMVGKKIARTLWRMGEESKDLVRSLVKIHDINCTIKPGVIQVNHRARFNRNSQEEAKLLNEEYGYSPIRYIDREECREIIDSTAYHGGTLDEGAAHLHPLNYALGLGKAVLDCGARIFECTRALSIEYGKPVEIHTDRSLITCDHLVLACNGYLGKLEIETGKRIMPVNNFIIATEPLEKELARSLIRDDMAVADSKSVINYFRFSEDYRLLFGGGESYSYHFPHNIEKIVRKPMMNVFPKLKEAKVEYAWGGVLAITMNRLPNFYRPYANVYSISGYSGHGVGMATLAGKLVSDAINGKEEGFETFQSVMPRKFPGGRFLCSPLLALAMLYYAILDRF